MDMYTQNDHKALTIFERSPAPDRKPPTVFQA